MAVQNLSLQEYKNAVNEATDAFSDTIAQLETLKSCLTEYQNASPAFITEFLSPQGIMTKKRDIDEQKFK